MFVSIYMHFILAINRAAINIFVLAFNPQYFVFFSFRHIPRNEIYWGKVDEHFGWLLTRLPNFLPMVKTDNVFSAQKLSVQKVNKHSP